ncbi:carbon-phosphorus lyase complex subunit PhnI [Rhodopila sp.]|uniref:carbon-phosphorus lyase complex subunit PhnI n=1 Tax=Rhodopila sp. TaxID=2480087 RepID=UPI003D0FCCB9
MAYVAVKGGEKAIDAAHAWLAEARRGDPATLALSIAQIENQLGRAVDRVMAEGSLYDRELAALAIKQAQGDLIEAAFLLRAYRTTLPRFAHATPVETAAMHIERRISAIYKDLPGGQVLGPTYDYTHRLLDFSLMESEACMPEAARGPCLAPHAVTGEGISSRPHTPVTVADDISSKPHTPVMAGEGPPSTPDGGDTVKIVDGGLSLTVPIEPAWVPTPRVPDILGNEGLLEPDQTTDREPGDLTRDPLSFPAARDIRLQALARGDEGFLLGLGYSTQRGYGGAHPFAGEIRMGTVSVEIEPAELGFGIDIGDLVLTECQMVNQFKGSKAVPPQFTRGYGLVFGFGERRAMAMALVDRALRAEELGEDVTAPAQDIEFVLYHSDNIEATGFVEHLKLPHYVDFQSELQNVRRMRAAAEAEAAE